MDTPWSENGENEMWASLCTPIEGLARLLVGANQRRLSEHMVPHRSLDRSLVGPTEAREHGIEGVELVEVAMTAYRGARTVIACPIPAVEADHCPRWHRIGLNALGKPIGCRRQIVKNPMNPGDLGCLWIGRIRIVDDEDEALCRLRYSGPGQGRGYVVAFAGILARNGSALCKGCRYQFEHHGFLLSCGSANKRNHCQHPHRHMPKEPARASGPAHRMCYPHKRFSQLKAERLPGDLIEE